MVATALRFRIVVGAGIALAVLSFLPLPTPHPEARLFSNGWGTAGATDPNFCLAPVGGVPRLALFDKAPCSAQWSDRLSLATHYLVWGLLPPAAALRIAFHPQGGARHPALLVFDLLGMDPAYFHWTVNPAFVGLYQWLEEAWFVRWPPGESQFIRLDALACLSGWSAGRHFWAVASVSRCRRRYGLRPAGRRQRAKDQPITGSSNLHNLTMNIPAQPASCQPERSFEGSGSWLLVTCIPWRWRSPASFPSPTLKRRARSRP